MEVCWISSGLCHYRYYNKYMSISYLLLSYCAYMCLYPHHHCSSCSLCCVWCYSTLTWSSGADRLFLLQTVSKRDSLHSHLHTVSLLFHIVISHVVKPPIRDPLR